MSTSYGPPVKDLVNHPPHYKANGMEAIDVIEAFAPGNYHRGNALKYLLRAGKKGDLLEDLRKAVWYIEREMRVYVANLPPEAFYQPGDDQMMPVPVSPPMARQEVFEHAMPDIDQGADDSHMTFPEEVPVLGSLRQVLIKEGYISGPETPVREHVRSPNLKEHEAIARMDVV